MHVLLTAPDSARLLVNDQMVDRGSWEGDLPAGRQHHFRARLEGAIPGCRSAQHDTVATLTPGQPANIDLEVAPCSVLLLTVRSNDAEFILTGKTFPFEKKGRYLGTPFPIVLRNGLYELVVRSEKCSDYTDKLLKIGPNAETASDTVTRFVPLNCGVHLK